MPPFQVKICGLATHGAMAAALEAGADMVGLVFHPRSPRHVGLADAANLARQAAGQALVVALVVDADDALLHQVHRAVKPDRWQFHGGESPARVAEVHRRYGLPVLRALGVGAAEDLAAAALFQGVAERLILDAKPPEGAHYPGGHGRPFDWTALRGLDPMIPFMLSGGLAPGNVGEAIRAARALGVRLAGVDVSSGVEAAPGVKDPAKIRAFVQNTREACS